MRGWLPLLLIAGCISDPTVPCGDLRCPAGLVCTPAGCATQEAEDACSRPPLADHAPCTTADIAIGACGQGVCHTIACGDAIVDPGEVCDDGNTADADGCAASCASDETCGNGVIDLVHQEECDRGLRGLSNDGCSSGCRIEQPTWRDVSPRPISARFGSAMARGPGNKIIAFGGSDGLDQLDDTWQWTGAQWLRLSPARSPSRRYYAMMAYDTVRNRVVLFGGFGTPAAYADTWVWDGTVWTELHPAHSPPARGWGSMVFDETRGRAVLFGGADEQSNGFGDTWLWDGGDWTEAVTTPAPPPRHAQMMAYNAKSRKTLLYGGFDGASTPSQLVDTWLWDGSSWTAVGGPGPTVSYGGAMAYDRYDKNVVLIGGYTTGGAPSSDTWVFDAAWIQATPGNTPTARTDGAAASQGANGVLLFGGIQHAAATTPLGDTWVWDAGSMNWFAQSSGAGLPSPRAFAALTYASRRGQIVQFGGTTQGGVSSQTWLWKGADWSPDNTGTLPPARTDHALAYDSKRDRVILFGGGYPRVGDMWTFDGTGWTAITAGPFPSPRAEAAMAYDEARDQLILFGGDDGSPGALGDTWAWDGTAWTQLSPPQSPPARSGHALAYDAARQRIVLYGAGSNDTWEWDGTTWIDRTPALSPPARLFEGLAYDPVRQRVVMVGGESSASGLFGDTWEWDGTAWTEVVSQTHPFPRHGAALAYDAVRREMVLFGGDGFLNLLGDTWALAYETTATPTERCAFADADEDGDGLVGCQDPDCWARCSYHCPPGTSCTSAATCGDGTCDLVEDYLICPADCVP